jgi:hypothetical protein
MKLSEETIKLVGDVGASGAILTARLDTELETRGYSYNPRIFRYIELVRQ